MSMKQYRHTLLPVIVSSLLVACSGVAPRDTGQALTGSEIQQLFTDKSFTLIGMKSGNELIVYADSEYCTMRYANASRRKTVRWYIEGDRHCCLKDGKAVCGEIRAMGGGRYHKVSAGRHTHTMREFVEGNRL
jgi:hypothetical protein